MCPAPVCQPELCGNGRDDDADGQVDCADPECAAEIACRPEVCDNGADDNANGATDCADAACFDAAACQPEICDDFVDNNGNGDLDCDDAQCAQTLACTGELCNDGQDNDNDGFTDCFDSDCEISPLCIEPLTEAEIQLIFDRSCGCHGGAAPSGGMSLAAPFTGATVNVRARNGGGLDRIEPGDHEASFLWLKLSGLQAAGQGSRMPQGGPYLDDVILARLALWIDQLPR